MDFISLTGKVVNNNVLFENYAKNPYCRFILMLQENGVEKFIPIEVCGKQAEKTSKKLLTASDVKVSGKIKKCNYYDPFFKETITFSYVIADTVYFINDENINVNNDKTTEYDLPRHYSYFMSNMI